MTNAQRMTNDETRMQKSQTGSHAAIAERFDQQEGVSGAAAAQAGDGVEEALFELEGDADRGENLLRDFGVFGGSSFAKGEPGRGSSNERGRVRHDADDSRL